MVGNPGSEKSGSSKPGKFEPSVVGGWGCSEGSCCSLGEEEGSGLSEGGVELRLWDGFGLDEEVGLGLGLGFGELLCDGLGEGLGLGLLQIALPACPPISTPPGQSSARAGEAETIPPAATVAANSKERSFLIDGSNDLNARSVRG